MGTGADERDITRVWCAAIVLRLEDLQSAATFSRQGIIQFEVTDRKTEEASFYVILGESGARVGSGACPGRANTVVGANAEALARVLRGEPHREPVFSVSGDIDLYECFFNEIQDAAEKVSWLQARSRQ